MSRFYGIYVKGKPNKILNLTKLTNFERTSCYKSEKLYTLKDIIKLTTNYDDELDFKTALFYSGIIELDDITKDIVVRSSGNSIEDQKIGKINDVIYKPCINLFKPSVLKELYLRKIDLPNDYGFLMNLVKEFKPYGISHDTGRRTSEVFIDEIYNILINYERNPEYVDISLLQRAINDFINHEIYYVIGENTPNGYDRQAKYKYRINDKNGKKLVDLHSMYEFALFYIHNNNLVNGKVSFNKLQGFKSEIVEELIRKRKEEQAYLEEALLLAEQDRKMFSNYCDEDNENNKSKSKIRKRKLPNIDGQIKLED